MNNFKFYRPRFTFCVLTIQRLVRQLLKKSHLFLVISMYMQLQILLLSLRALYYIKQSLCSAHLSTCFALWNKQLGWDLVPFYMLTHSMLASITRQKLIKEDVSYEEFETNIYLFRRPYFRVTASNSCAL